MELIIIVICILAIILLKIGLNIQIRDIKKIKQIGYDKDLNKIAQKFPNNIDICKDMLKVLKKDNVKIEESKETKTSLYIAITNKIIIANINDTFTRIQTIAHECLHSVQNRKILLFNFIYSNIFLLYFIVSFFLILFKVGNELTYILIFVMLALILCIIRAYLENEAMSKAIFIAKEYMQEQEKINNNITKDNVDLLVEKFDELNKIGIPLTNFSIVTSNIIKIIILAIVSLI